MWVVVLLPAGVGEGTGGATVEVVNGDVAVLDSTRLTRPSEGVETGSGTLSEDVSVGEERLTKVVVALVVALRGVHATRAARLRQGCEVRGVEGDVRAAPFHSDGRKEDGGTGQDACGQ